MLFSPDLMRAALLICILGMTFLAVFYLRQRPLSLLAYTCLGLLALCLPVLGPFIVIWIQPGKRSVLCS
ncbi:MAG: hypothetical protein JW862_04090 [Anaerolineales bacterium]|nr:hypothetical protein [Anaerolineales bacterium]